MKHGVRSTKYRIASLCELHYSLTEPPSYTRMMKVVAKALKAGAAVTYRTEPARKFAFIKRFGEVREYVRVIIKWPQPSEVTSD